jgi:hypothetical protein
LKHRPQQNPADEPDFQMPVEYVIDKEKRLVITRAWDRVTYADFKAHQDRLLSDSGFDPNFRQLLDATKVTSSDITASDVRELTSRPVFSPTSSRAFVAVNPAYFGIGRMAEAYLSLMRLSSETRVFYDLTSALEWLGLTQDDIQWPEGE